MSLITGAHHGSCRRRLALSIRCASGDHRMRESGRNALRRWMTPERCEWTTNARRSAPPDWQPDAEVAAHEEAVAEELDLCILSAGP